jgi:excisionase family DNA binding protein
VTKAKADGDKLIDARTLADILKVSVLTVYRKVQEGSIPAYKIGRFLRFDPEEVKAALRSK